MRVLIMVKTNILGKNYTKTIDGTDIIIPNIHIISCNLNSSIDRYLLVKLTLSISKLFNNKIRISLSNDNHSIQLTI